MSALHESESPAPRAQDDGALLQFLNAAPIGLVQIDHHGAVEMINAESARLLLPLAPSGDILNLFELLQDLLPDLPQQVQRFKGVHGRVVDNCPIDLSDRVPASAEAQHLTLSLMKLDAVRLMAVFTDVTRQVRTERALRSSERRLQLALSASRVGEWELDLETGVVQRSPLHDQLFGYSTHQPQWSLEHLLRHVHPEDLAIVSYSFQQAVSSGSDWETEFRVVWADDSVHWLSARGHIERNERNERSELSSAAADAPGTASQAGRMLCILVDTTTQRQFDAHRARAQQLEAENSQVREASKLKSQFLANMSHELRTPLNAIIGFAELLHRGAVPADSPKHDQFLKHISSSGHHLLQLINDVLDMAKVEAGKLDFNPEALDLHTLVAEVVEVLQPGIQTKGLIAQVEVAPELNALMLDPMRLKQVLFNYLSNAIKFTPAGGKVQLRARAEGPDHFRIEVEDNGIGIADAEINQLFVEFHQLASTHRASSGGTGLGLSLTRRLVQAQGGRVGVRSTPGVGTVFYAVLNRVHGWDAEHALSLGDTPSRLATRMLVIESQPQREAALVDGLAAAGFRVDTAADMHTALSQASDIHYGGITLDMALPDRLGLGLLARIRSESASRDSPVVGLSLPDPQGHAARFAISNVLSKPIRGDEVLSAIGDLHLPPDRELRVMVVDDDPLAQDLMRATLTAIGVQAQVFSSGEQALEAIAEVAPDALILDLMMPGMNGFDVLAALKQMPAGRSVPVFVWTSMSLSDAEYTTLSRSAAAILAKGGGELADMIEDLRQWQHSVQSVQSAQSAQTPKALRIPH